MVKTVADPATPVLGKAFAINMRVALSNSRVFRPASIGRDARRQYGRGLSCVL
ncbi:MAG: hypothetical protein ACRYG8_51965 [Janthinobacterium lividum]